ncbi:MAG: hypothetical protein IK003_05155 [Prevotella sp.]|nr:hypothetical protein [Prevotella sp.]
MELTNNRFMTELSKEDKRMVNGGESKEEKHRRWAQACMDQGCGGSIWQGIGHAAIEVASWFD